MSVDDLKIEGYLRRRQRRIDVMDRAMRVAGGLVLAGIVALALVLRFNGCEAGDERSIDAVESAGYENVRLGGASWSCADSESSRSFEATTSTGVRVRGTVCCGLTGLGKGCTIRW